MTVGLLKMLLFLKFGGSVTTLNKRCNITSKLKETTYFRAQSASLVMSTSTKGNRVRRNLNFSADEISALIQVWGSPDMQRKFSLGLTRHSVLYEEISAFMKAMGFEREADVLQTKVANLKSKYYVEKSTSSKSGSSPSTWIHYDEMHRVLGSRPLANDGWVTDSLRSSTLVEDNTLHGFSETEDSQLLENSNDVNSSSSSWNDSGSSASPSDVSSFSSGTTPTLDKNTFVVRKTKRPQSDNSLLAKILENDKRMIELTEKRLKLEAETRIKHEHMLDAATNFFNSFARGNDLNFPSPPIQPSISSNFTFPKQTKSVPLVPNTVPLVQNTVPLVHNAVQASSSQAFRIVPTKVTGLKPVQRSTSHLPRLTIPAPAKPGNVIAGIKQPAQPTLEQVQKPVIFRAITISKNNMQQ